MQRIYGVVIGIDCPTDKDNKNNIFFYKNTSNTNLGYEINNYIQKFKEYNQNKNIFTYD